MKSLGLAGMVTDADSAMVVTNQRHNPLIRCLAALFATRSDRKLAATTTCRSGRLLAAHESRLVSTKERDRLRDWLAELTLAAHGPDYRNKWGEPIGLLNNQPIIECRKIIYDIRSRLQDSGLVDSRGIAKLRLLLADGCGPLYLDGHGDLQQELLAVLEAL